MAQSIQNSKTVAYDFVLVVALQAVLQEILRQAHYIKRCLSCAR